MSAPLHTRPFNLEHARAAVVLLVLLCAGCELKHDDSDPPDGQSGLYVQTDNLTGCQYLAAGHTLYPRMGANGKQICRQGAKP